MIANMIIAANDSKIADAIAAPIINPTVNKNKLINITNIKSTQHLLVLLSLLQQVTFICGSIQFTSQLIKLFYKPLYEN